MLDGPVRQVDFDTLFRTREPSNLDDGEPDRTTLGLWEVDGAAARRLAGKGRGKRRGVRFIRFPAGSARRAACGIRARPNFPYGLTDNRVGLEGASRLVSDARGST